jgi:hypothetical protein
MKGNTPKLIQKMCDDIEAAEADVRSGDPDLQLHGFTALIAIMSEQAALVNGEMGDYPEGRRMAAFVQKRMDDLNAAKAAVERVLEQKKEAEKQREEWRKEVAEREAKRKAAEKERRAAEKRDASFLEAVRREEREREQKRRAEEDAKQGKLFG